MGWVSPTGFVDPDSKWSNEPNAYDGDTGTKVDAYVKAGVWTAFLELTHAAILCDKLRFWATRTDWGIHTIDLDVYYEGGWHNVYQGDYASDTWVEKSIPAGEKSVTAVNVRFYNSHDAAQYVSFWEFDFWEVVVGWTGKISGVTNPAKIMGVDVANIHSVKGVIAG